MVNTKTSKFDAWVVLTLIFSFLMSFSIGSNDAANGLGTSYGTNAMPIRWLMTNGAIAEFVGAMFFSDKVATTLSQDIVPGMVKLDDSEKKRMMFSVVVSCFIFIILASYGGMPVSGTHATVGALLGSGAVLTSFKSLAWGKLSYIIISWLASPTLAAIFSMILMSFVCHFTLNTGKNGWSWRCRILWIQSISGFCFMMMFFLGDKILGNDKIELEKEIKYAEEHQLCILLSSAFFCGIIFCRFLIYIHLLILQSRKTSFSFNIMFLFYCLFWVLGTTWIEALTLNLEHSGVRKGNERVIEYEEILQKLKAVNESLEKQESPQHDFKTKVDFTNYNFDMPVRWDNYEKPGKENQLNEVEKEGGETAESTEKHEPMIYDSQVEIYIHQQAMLTCNLFRCLMVMSDFLVCMAHGSNDVGNAISPLIVVMNTADQPAERSFFLGSMGIAFGLFLFGERVMKTIGEDVILLDYAKGFSLQFAAAICVCLGSSLGLPLSTTHCIVGALIGIFFASRTQKFKQVYKIDPDAKDDKGLDMKKIKEIIYGWIITVPFAMAVAASICWILGLF